MQTVNFRCGHCGNLMAVATTHLSQQVRCPHCQQVVTAPASAAAPAPAPAATVPAAPPPPKPPPLPEPIFRMSESARDHDSIFAPPEEADEDLFGGSPKPRLEMPPDNAWPQVPAFPPGVMPSNLPATAFEPVAPAPTETVSWMTPPSVQETAAPESPAVSLADATAPGEDGKTDVLAGVARPVREIKHTAGGNPWILPLVILPLISYSVLLTILLAMAYTRPAPPHPLEMQCDDDGSNPPARRTGKERVRRSYNWHRRQLDDLPAKQHVRLGEDIVIGDVRVRPLEAELRPVMIYTAGYPEPDPSPHPTLVLHLEIQNVSDDVVFYPLDAYFDRRFEEKFLENAPFTYLEKGEKRFFGGAAAFGSDFKGREVRAEALELRGLDGDPNKKLPQNVNKELMPGEKWRTFVTCNADSPEVADALQNYDGPLLYRVRLRRGLVPFKGQEVSATTVIGVEFTGKDVKRSG